MRYTSTRSAISLSASEIILQGLSKEGGLFVPTSFPASFFNETLLNDTYHSLAKKVCEVYLSDYSRDAISNIVDQGYHQTSFVPEPVIMKPFKDMSFLELFHGPRHAAADIEYLIICSPIFQNQ